MGIHNIKIDDAESHGQIQLLTLQINNGNHDENLLLGKHILVVSVDCLTMHIQKTNCMPWNVNPVNEEFNNFLRYAKKFVLFFH